MGGIVLWRSHASYRDLRGGGGAGVLPAPPLLFLKLPADGQPYLMAVD